MITIFCTIYLAAMLFMTAWCLIIIVEHTKHDPTYERLLVQSKVYAATAILWAIWYMYYLN